MKQKFSDRQQLTPSPTQHPATVSVARLSRKAEDQALRALLLGLSNYADIISTALSYLPLELLFELQSILLWGHSIEIIYSHDLVLNKAYLLREAGIDLQLPHQAPSLALWRTLLFPPNQLEEAIRDLPPSSYPFVPLPYYRYYQQFQTDQPPQETIDYQTINRWGVSFVQWYKHITPLLITPSGFRSDSFPFKEEFSERVQQATQLAKTLLQRIRTYYAYSESPDLLEQRLTEFLIKAQTFQQETRYREALQCLHHPMAALNQDLNKDDKTLKINERVKALQECQRFLNSLNELEPHFIETLVLFHVSKHFRDIRSVFKVLEKNPFALRLSPLFYRHYIDYLRCFFDKISLFKRIFSNQRLLDYLQPEDDFFAKGLPYLSAPPGTLARVLKRNPQLYSRITPEIWLKANEDGAILVKFMYPDEKLWSPFSSQQRYQLIDLHPYAFKKWYKKNSSLGQRYLQGMDFVELQQLQSLAYNAPYKLFLGELIQERLACPQQQEADSSLEKTSSCSRQDTHSSFKKSDRLPILNFNKSFPFSFRRSFRTAQHSSWTPCQKRVLVGVALLSLALCVAGVGILSGGAAVLGLSAAWSVKLLITYKATSGMVSVCSGVLIGSIGILAAYAMERSHPPRRHQPHWFVAPPDSRR